MADWSYDEKIGAHFVGTIFAPGYFVAQLLIQFIFKTWK